MFSFILGWITLYFNAGLERVFPLNFIKIRLRVMTIPMEVVAIARLYHKMAAEDENEVVEVVEVAEAAEVAKLVDVGVDEEITLVGGVVVVVEGVVVAVERVLALIITKTATTVGPNQTTRWKPHL